MNSVKLFKILSESLRVRILHLLKQAPLSVGEMVDILGQSQSNISHHVKLLAESGLIEFHKKGNLNLYHLADNPPLPEVAASLWTELANLAADLPEASNDYPNLVKALTQREKKGLPDDWASWRQVQPDLPHTFEVAFQGLPRAGIALDAGCGDGELSRLLQASYRQVIGMDYSREQLQKATGKLDLLQGDVHDLPFADQSIDSVYLRMVLQFLRDPTGALSECVRVLKPGGRISVIDNSAEFDANFFNEICSNYQDMRVARFTTHPHVMLCALERIGK